MRHIRSTRWSWVAALAALALLVSACPAEDDDAEAPDDEEEHDEHGETVEGFTYNTGIFEDTRTDNYWAYLDPDSTVWTGYVLDNTKCSLYDVTLPAIQITPDLAAEDVPDPQEEEDGTWVVEVQMRDDVEWSDGEPVTAEDMAFTFEVVQQLGLGFNWASNYVPEPVDDGEAEEGEEGAEEAEEVEANVSAIEAVDEHTVRIEFTGEPGLGVWPNRVGVASIMPEHFWADVYEEAQGSDEPQEVLYGASGEGDPSCGPAVFEEWEADAFVRVSANDAYHHRGEEVQQYENAAVVIDGEEYGPESPEGDPIAEYNVGPFFDDMVYTLYGAQDSAVLALRQGEVDYLFNPLGLERGLQEPVIEDENLEIAVNPSYGMRYLAFNLRNEPMSDLAFRQALATMVDREFMAETVLGGVAFPMFTMLPEGNVAWYDEEAAEEISAPYRDFADEGERLDAAVEILTEAGYSWEEEPTVDEEGAVVAGSGIMMPDGSPMQDIVLNSLSPGYDPLRATYGLWIERWAQELGMPVTAELTGFGPLVDVAFPGGGEEPTFDMFILGWSLGNPAFPDFYESFWHSRNDPDPNAPGFNNEEYDDAVDRFMSAATFEEAQEILWDEVEPILQEELPYLVLFDTPIVEGYRHASIRYPYVETLSGIQFQNGMPSVVQGVQ